MRIRTPKRKNRTNWYKLIVLIVGLALFGLWLNQIHQLDKEMYGNVSPKIGQSGRTPAVLSQTHTPNNTGSQGEAIEARTDYQIRETSCYTGVESKGANGRNPWSAATYAYPQGTRLWIEGVGERIVETVTAPEYRHRVDLWFGETLTDHEKCINYGSPKRKIWVIS